MPSVYSFNLLGVLWFSSNFWKLWMSFALLCLGVPLLRAAKQGQLKEQSWIS